MTRGLPSGHRTSPHTADLRIEAWAPTRERCIAEAVSGLVASFAGNPLPPPDSTVECDVSGDDDAELLVAVLDEVIYRMDTAGQVPAATEVVATPGGLRVRFAMVDAATVTTSGAIPKAVSLHELRFGTAGDRWTCSVTIDV